MSSLVFEEFKFETFFVSYPVRNALKTFGLPVFIFAQNLDYFLHKKVFRVNLIPQMKSYTLKIHFHNAGGNQYL